MNICENYCAKNQSYTDINPKDNFWDQNENLK